MTLEPGPDNVTGGHTGTDRTREQRLNVGLRRWQRSDGFASEVRVHLLPAPPKGREIEGARRGRPFRRGLSGLRFLLPPGSAWRIIPQPLVLPKGWDCLEGGRAPGQPRTGLGLAAGLFSSHGEGQSVRVGTRCLLGIPAPGL